MEKQCYRCGHKMVKAGASSKGYQRYRCTGCGHSYTSKVELANASPRISAQSHTLQSAAPSRLPSVQSSNTVSIRQAPRGNADVQLSDLILTFFFGWLGYWQFKNKKYGLGVVWLLTLGLFGIGWLVDFVIVLMKYIQSNSSRSAASSDITQAVAPSYPQPIAQSALQMQQSAGAKPDFPELYQGVEKTYEYEDVKLYTVPEECPNFNGIRLYGRVEFIQEPENLYDDKAVYVTQSGVKLGYLYRGTLQDMANDYLRRGRKLLGVVSGLDYQNGVITISMAFYK